MAFFIATDNFFLLIVLLVECRKAHLEITRLPSTYTLPNGLTIYHNQAYETDFVYQEVFVQKIYTRAFPDLPQTSCVIDVGANIGLFSLFIKQQFPQAVVYAFEPSPVHFQLCELNLKKQDHVHLYQKGLGETETTKTFTYYPHYSVMSGFHANVDEDKALLAAGIASQLQLDQPDKAEHAERYIEILMDNKLDDAQQFDCKITTLSTLINTKHISRIDLLKIDAEKAEQEVLAGIREQDWRKIDRVVLEAHDQSSCEKICALLNKQGYRVNHNKSSEFKSAAIFMIYANRRSS